MQTSVESRPRKSPLLEETRQLMRARHMSIRTEESCLRWIEQHPAEMSDGLVNRP